MGNFYMEATQINYRRDDTLKTVDQKLQELSQESAIDTDIAPVFKSTSTYNPGDMVYYRNKLYVCNTQHSGAWAAADFTATDVSTALNAAVGALDETKADYADIAGAFSAETAYTAGDLVIYNGIIYRCTNDHTGDWDADDFSATTIGAELNSISSNLLSIGTVVNSILNPSEQDEFEGKYVIIGKLCVFSLIVSKTQSSYTLGHISGVIPLLGWVKVAYDSDNNQPVYVAAAGGNTGTNIQIASGPLSNKTYVSGCFLIA